MIGMLLSSCSKDVADLYEHEITSFPKSLVDPSNSNNALDTAGYIHNEQLITFVDSFLLRGKIKTKNDLADFFNANNQQIYILENYGDIFPNDPSTFDSLLYAAHQATPIFHEYFKELEGIVSDPRMSLNEKIIAIKDYENSFNYQIYPSNVSKSLKVVSSIARYSIFLWAPKSQGGLGYYDKVLEAKRIDWWEVGVDDIMGTALSGVFAPTPVTALAGGVLASAYTVAKSYWW